MAALPGYAYILLDGLEESFDPSVSRTEMERGPPKQETVNSQVLVKLTATLLFVSADDAAAFETWYFDTIGRVGSFTFVHPRTGATLTGWFPGGDIGKLVMLGPGNKDAQRTCVIEYLR